MARDGAWFYKSAETGDSEEEDRGMVRRPSGRSHQGEEKRREEEARRHHPHTRACPLSLVARRISS